MEAINDSSKLVAQATRLIQDYVRMNDIENEALLTQAIELLEEALNKLTDKM